ncbi:RNA polymerase sigma factor [Paenibacillus alkalitolerans]|uniref:RNA polymerase sigma factor n=1 Tax=Paenibacillus alkalitolerans TaxID=2799335 RepID=UPI0018F4E52C|nr:sigma-70 family RNA polymerase sigma factor [Paenibacillus alkalitolerans]
MTERELFETYNKEVYRTCYSMLGNAMDAEDVCQEVFITVFGQNWASIEYFRTWLLRVTVNHCLNHIRKRRSLRTKEALLRMFTLRTADRPADAVVEEQETASECASYISLLPEKIRMSVSLRYMNDLSFQEISEVLQIPVGTVKSRVHYGIKMLKKIIEREDLKAKEGGAAYERSGSAYSAMER